ncbi:MAG TPA: divalent-cation tolerance protein CutA [Dehalococcoidales bacterium]
MSDAAYVVIFITASSETEARRITDALLTQRRAACVNIIPAVNSSFWWQGKLESVAESLLIVKTKASLVNEVVALVKENHSYTVPEIIALPILGGNPDYLEWIEKEVK